jgi:hypothetical protein
VKKVRSLGALGAMLLVGAGLWVTGCKSTPPLSQDDALKLIQAYYDQQPASSITINVNETGMKQGYAAKYWQLTKVYPNKLWADYTLTDDGKKALTLNGGGVLIQWRPDADAKGHFYVTTVATTHPKPHDVSEPQDDTVANVETAKTASFTESVNFTGVPQPLQDVAHNPGNTLSTKRHAEFALEGGAWKVHSIH